MNFKGFKEVLLRSKFSIFQKVFNDHNVIMDVQKMHLYQGMEMRKSNLYPATKSPLPNVPSANKLMSSKSLKNCANTFRVSISFDPDEAPSYSASHPDPSCLHMGLYIINPIYDNKA